MTPIIKPVGASQIEEMIDLEGHFDAVKPLWPGATAEKAKITDFRTKYEAALDGRKAAGQKASNVRAARDVAKEDFLNVYAEIASRAKAEFSRNRKMQDLFFDAVWAPAEMEDAGDEAGDDSPEGEQPG